MLLDISGGRGAHQPGINWHRPESFYEYTPRSPSMSPPPPPPLDAMHMYLPYTPPSRSLSPTPPPPSYADAMITINDTPPPPPPPPSSSSMTSSLPPEQPIVTRAAEGLILAALETITTLLRAILEAMQRRR